jgi:hypothetical protein
MAAFSRCVRPSSHIVYAVGPPVKCTCRYEALLSWLPFWASSRETYWPSTKKALVRSRSAALTCRRREMVLLVKVGLAGGKVKTPVKALTCHLGPSELCPALRLAV